MAEEIAAEIGDGPSVGVSAPARCSCGRGRCRRCAAPLPGALGQAALTATDIEGALANAGHGLEHDRVVVKIVFRRPSVVTAASQTSPPPDTADLEDDVACSVVCRWTIDDGTRRRPFGATDDRLVQQWRTGQQELAPARRSDGSPRPSGRAASRCRAMQVSRPAGRFSLRASLGRRAKWAGAREPTAGSRGSPPSGRRTACR
jgi:hypothetical protein